jgi:hypothetical protein
VVWSGGGEWIYGWLLSIFHVVSSGFFDIYYI